MKKQHFFLLLFLVGIGSLLTALTVASRWISPTSKNEEFSVSPKPLHTDPIGSKIRDRASVSSPPPSNPPTVRQTLLTVQVDLQPEADGKSVNVLLRHGRSEIGSKQKVASSTDSIQCVFEPLEAGFTYTIIASASDYLPTRKNVTVQEGENVLSLVLYPHPILSLQINNQNSAPVPGAKTEIRSKSQGIFSADYEADEKGFAKIEAPYPGDYDVIASHPLYSERAHKVIRLDGNPNLHTIVLSGKTGMIFGKASSETGQVIADASVTLFGSNKHNQLALTHTRENGCYRFDALRLTEYYVHMDAGDQYIDDDIEYVGRRKREPLFPHVTLTPNNFSAEVNFLLSPSILIHGIVIDSTGGPISEALIKAGIQGNRLSSIRPVVKEVKTDAQGEFTFPVKTRVQGWTTLMLSAIHPEYGSVSDAFGNFQEEYRDKTVVLTMEKNLGSLNATVVSSHSREPLPSIEVQFLLTAFRGDERYQKKAVSDANGRLQLTLPVGNHIVRVDGRPIQSPQRIAINPNQETSVTLFVENDGEKKITISGIVVNQDHAPVHGARVFILAGERAAGQSASNPKGQFQFEMNESDIREDRTLIVSHPLYRNAETPISEIPDLCGVVIVLKENPGAVLAVMKGIDDAMGIEIQLKSVEKPFYSRIEETDGTPMVLLRNIDESMGPFYLMAGGGSYAGISPVFDLRDNATRYLEVEIPMHPIDGKTSLAIHVTDSKTNEPISIANCEIEGNTFTPAGKPSPYRKRAVTHNDGFATLNDVPQCQGFLHITHVHYQEVRIPFYHDGINPNRVIAFQLFRNEE